MTQTSTAAEQTLNWIRSFIIKFNICPFAKGPVNKGTLRITVSETKKRVQALEELMKEIDFLNESASMETTLLIFTNQFNDFFAYLDFVDLAEQLMQSQGYEGVYQLATFHPDYYFNDTEPDDVTNYTNRSPYPMIHILREDSLEKAITAYGHTEQIPENNIRTMRQLGLNKIQEILNKA